MNFKSFQTNLRKYACQKMTDKQNFMPEILLNKYSLKVQKNTYEIGVRIPSSPTRFLLGGMRGAQGPIGKWQGPPRNLEKPL